jgi:tRNA G18 (ribose-2'-O)-methylase SpoU
VSPSDSGEDGEGAGRSFSGLNRAVVIDDPGDARLADYRHLNDARFRPQVEAPGATGTYRGYFVAEGLTVVERLIRSGRPVRSLLVDPARLARLDTATVDADVPIYVATQAVLEAVAGFPVHRGALAAADRWPLPESAGLLAVSRRIAVLEGVNDHENLGALFRNAAGLGVEAVMLDPRCCDPFYRRSVRVSMGHVLTVPWTRLEPWPAALGAVRDAGFTVLALTPTAGAEPIDAIGDLPDRIAVLLGAEGPGLSAGALAASDRLVRIPMTPGVDSLNVASAAAVAFWAVRPGRATAHL